VYAVPHWDARTDTLHCFDQRLKVRFDAANLRVVLDAFEAQGWPRRIANPLRAGNGVTAKRKLQQTVKSLSERLRGTGLRLRMDGEAMGVCWESDV
jgi:hypothetical protein